jgi:uncharacterized protein
MITLEMVREDEEIDTLIGYANQYLRSLGYTDHGPRHAGTVAITARDILRQLGYAERACVLAGIAGYLHDMGNATHREGHAQTGSLLAQRILDRMGMPVAESVVIANAIGNHEEERGFATTPIAAALIIADKSDVHRSRVQTDSFDDFDIHDRVNYATTSSRVTVDPEANIISLELTIDSEFAHIIEYFEIFMDRMTMVRQATEFLNCRFRLVINETAFS